MSSAPSLNDSFRLLLPELPDELVSSAQRQRLSDLAGRLAPIHYAGLECRLGSQESAVDLQQRILASDHEPARLVRHIESGPLAERPVWQRVLALCTEWQTGGSALDQAIGACWLEIDEGASVPSVFLSLSPTLGRPRTADEVLEIAATAVDLLTGGSLPDGFADNVRVCVEAAPEGTRVTDLAFMLGRHAEALRLAVSPFRAEEFGSYLGEISAPPGGTDLARVAVGDALAVLPGSAERLQMSLDIGRSILPRVGLEYSPGGGQTGSEPLWRDLLDALVAAGLCTRQKSAALLRWPGWLEPGAAEGKWPDDLIVKSLLRGPDRFVVLGRRLNHVKIVCVPGGDMEAKVYFGFAPLWLRPGAREQRGRTGGRVPGHSATGARSLSRGPSRDATSSDLEAELRVALRRGIEFLTGAREPTGLWLDFESVAGGSGEWVTAYTGAILAALPFDEARDLARRAMEVLSRRAHGSGGWAYNAGLPPDADTTAWVLRLASSLSARDFDRESKGARFLSLCVCSDGGLSSYRSADLPALQQRLGEVDMRGLHTSHACVTAAAAELPTCADHCTEYLKRTQKPDGWWEAFWWCDPEYATALAVEALSSLMDQGEESNQSAAACVARAASWAKARFTSSGAVSSPALAGFSTFATALCCRVLLADEAGEDTEDRVLPAVDWLLREQMRDGSWEESAVMRVPPSHSSDPVAKPHETFFALDRRRVFTTATVLWTLGRVLDLQSKRA